LLHRTLVAIGPFRHFAALQQSVAIGDKTDIHQTDYNLAYPRP